VAAVPDLTATGSRLASCAQPGQGRAPRSGWIEIEGQQSVGAAARIWIWRPGMNRQIWNVLIGAGAHPIGPAPPP
jgi:hypothetical protein